MRTYNKTIDCEWLAMVGFNVFEWDHPDSEGLCEVLITNGNGVFLFSKMTTDELNKSQNNLVKGLTSSHTLLG